MMMGRGAGAEVRTHTVHAHTSTVLYSTGSHREACTGTRTRTVALRGCVYSTVPYEYCSDYESTSTVPASVLLL